MTLRTSNYYAARIYINVTVHDKSEDGESRSQIHASESSPNNVIVSELSKFRHKYNNQIVILQLQQVESPNVYSSTPLLCTFKRVYFNKNKRTLDKSQKDVTKNEIIATKIS